VSLRLICAATEFELAAWGEPAKNERLVVSGVGIPETFITLFRAMATHQDIREIVNIGIAGAYRDSGLLIGDIVIGESEVYGDIGFELPEPPYFRPIQDSDFGAGYKTPFVLHLPENPKALIGPKASIGRGCTVSTCTGTEAVGALRRRLFHADFETMEGAAVAQIGAQFGIPVREIRAISNYAAHREMTGENIRAAINSLSVYLISNFCQNS
jgi:futalosine hydrolase